MSEPLPQAPDAQSALAIICGAGTLPFALADAASKRGRRVVLFALRGWADPQRVADLPERWAGGKRLQHLPLLVAGLLEQRHQPFAVREQRDQTAETGLAEQLGSVYIPTYAIVVTFLIMVLVLALRPQGLLARR